MVLYMLKTLYKLIKPKSLKNKLNKFMVTLVQNYCIVYFVVGAATEAPVKSAVNRNSLLAKL